MEFFHDNFTRGNDRGSAIDADLTQVLVSISDKEGPFDG